MSASRSRQRQAAKERTKQIKGLYFVVRWLDDGDDVIFDTLSSKDIVSPEGVDVLNLSSGDKCSALFKGHEYQVEIIACGAYSEMKQIQQLQESAAEQQGYDVIDSEEQSMGGLQGMPAKNGREPKNMKGVPKKPRRPTDSSLVTTPKRTKVHKKSSPKKQAKDPPLKQGKKLAEELEHLSSEDDDSEILGKKRRRKKQCSESASSDTDGENEEERSLLPVAPTKIGRQIMGLGQTAGSVTQFALTADIAVMKEKIRTLEVTQHKLKNKVYEQDREIKRLRRESSYEMSSTSDIHSLEDWSPTGLRMSSQGHFRSPTPIQTRVPIIKRENSTGVLSFDESKIDQLRLASAKLQPDAGRAAQKLMDVLFTTEEMVNGNPSGNSKSRDATRLATISPLDPARMKYIFDFLDSKWPGSSTDKAIRRKMTQKCTDYYNDTRYKHLRRGGCVSREDEIQVQD